MGEFGARAREMTNWRCACEGDCICGVTAEMRWYFGVRLADLCDEELWTSIWPMSNWLFCELYHGTWEMNVWRYMLFFVWIVADLHLLLRWLFSSYCVEMMRWGRYYQSMINFQCYSEIAVFTVFFDSLILKFFLYFSLSSFFFLLFTAFLNTGSAC